MLHLTTVDQYTVVIKLINLQVVMQCRGLSKAMEYNGRQFHQGTETC